MTDWTAGYVADIGYTYGYYPQLNPLRLRMAFLDAGLVCPEVGAACELGFGQGVSANMHAAASVTQWHGTDFNPSQASFAQSLAAASGAPAHLVDDAFAEFCSRPDLPDFDYIGLHGIWSWISDENRAVIVDFIRRKLKTGGALYISYNTLPGWAPFVPMRGLLTEHSELMGAPGQGIVPRIDAALEFAEKLLATQPGYVRANPQVSERLARIKTLSRNYLAHEYFNRDWHPMSFSSMARWLEPAKLSYACSAEFLDHVDALNLTTDQQALINSLPDANFRQTVRDFCVNQQFRKDYWVKGARKLSSFEQSEALRAQRVLLVQKRSAVSLKVTGGLGEANLQGDIYNPLLDLLADHLPRSLGQIEQALKDRNIGLAKIEQSVMILLGSGALELCQEDAVVAKARKYTDKLNTYLCMKARSAADVTYLASPVSGGAAAIPRFSQVFVLARAQGKKQPADLAQFAWQWLAAQNQLLIKEGKTLATPDENLAELETLAKDFAENQLPILKSLGIC